MMAINYKLLIIKDVKFTPSYFDKLYPYMLPINFKRVFVMVFITSTVLGNKLEYLRDDLNSSRKFSTFTVYILHLGKVPNISVKNIFIDIVSIIMKWS
jgi:hypothetical protein